MPISFFDLTASTFDFSACIKLKECVRRKRRNILGPVASIVRANSFVQGPTFEKPIRVENAHGRLDENLERVTLHRALRLKNQKWFKMHVDIWVIIQNDNKSKR